MTTEQIQSILQDAVTKVATSDVIEQAIEEAITKAVIGAINDSLRSYSEFGKQLQKAVEQSLQIHGDLNLPSYNQQILKIVERQVATATEQSLQKQVAERMKDLLTEPPESIRLTELVDQYRAYLRERSDAGCVCHGEQQFTFIYEVGDYGSKICFSEESGVEKYKCDISISFTKETGKIYGLRLGHEKAGELFAGPFYSFERSLYQMHAAGTKILVDIEDESDIDTDYSSGDY